MSATCRRRSTAVGALPACAMHQSRQHYRADRWSIAWWNQRSGRDGGHGSGHHRPHDGNRALQFGARLHRDGNRCCRLGQYHRDWVHFSDVRPLGGVSKSRGCCLDRRGLSVGRHAGDATREISRLARCPCRQVGTSGEHLHSCGGRLVPRRGGVVMTVRWAELTEEERATLVPSVKARSSH